MDIYNASHDTDLKPSGAVYLNIDTAVLGLGNSSCGPGVLKKYAIEKKEHTVAGAHFSFWLEEMSRR